jgi:PST family polysaccharide transporter
MRIAMIVAGAGVTWFAGAYALELVFDTLFMAFLYRLTTRVRLSEWRAQAPLMRELLAFSWPLIFSGLMASIYLKIDQVMIGQMLDDRAVGYYAAAVRLSETFYMMSSVALTSVFPSLVRARQIDFKLYLSRIQRLYDLFVWFAIGLGTVMQVAAVPVVTLLYGRAFLPGAQALAIHVWSGLFWFSGSVGHRYLVTENHARTALWMTVAGAVVNVVLNVFMIPAWGISGAALATLLSFAVSHCLAGLAFPPARIFVQFFLRALNPFGVVARLRAGDVRAG